MANLKAATRVAAPVFSSDLPVEAARSLILDLRVTCGDRGLHLAEGLPPATDLVTQFGEAIGTAEILESLYRRLSGTTHGGSVSLLSRLAVEQGPTFESGSAAVVGDARDTAWLLCVVAIAVVAIRYVRCDLYGHSKDDIDALVSDLPVDFRQN